MSISSKSSTKTSAIVAASVALALALAAATARADDDSLTAPNGIVATNGITLRQVLANHRRAVGTLPANLVATRIEHWSISETGISGTRTIVDRKDDKRVDTTLGPLHSAFGTLGGIRWNQNANGEVVIEHDLHQQDDIDARALREAEAGTANGVELLGGTTEPIDAYVVRVAPPRGRIEYAFYDAKTFLIDRIEEARLGRRYVTTYIDFRTTQGRTRAWHVSGSNGESYDDVDLHLQDVSYGANVTAAQLAMPQSHAPVIVPASPTLLPATILNDRIVLKARIGGRPVDLQLDSGAAGIVLNQDVADALKLPHYGKHTANTAGSYTAGNTIVPKIDLGGVSLANVAVVTAPFVYWANEKTPIAGLIGFDFIDGLVLHIDYVAGTVTAIDPASFVAPAGATSVPIELDDDVPIVSATIGDTDADHFILDTGADRSMLFSGFVAAHPHDTSDRGLGDLIQASFPFPTWSYGVGGMVQYRSVQIGPFGFAGKTFPTWMFYATHHAASFEFEDYDGLIGQDVLRYFDVYLDYPHQRILFVPNRRYAERFE